MTKIDTENPRLTFAQIKLTVNGIEILAKAINYDDGVDFSDVEGNAQMLVGRTAGMYKASEGTLELYLDEYAQVLESLGDAFFTKSWDATVAYEYAQTGSTGGQLKQDTLVGCRFTKRSSQNQSGNSDALTRSLSFKPAYIKMNGHDPLPKAMMPTGAK